MSSPARAISEYVVAYSDPIRVQKGDVLKLTGRRDNWNGHIWLWAIATDGREGWIPDNLIDQAQSGETLAVRDYSAQELNCSVGEELTILTAEHGWCWCQNQQGELGWIPQEQLAPLELS